MHLQLNNIWICISTREQMDRNQTCQMNKTNYKLLPLTISLQYFTTKDSFSECDFAMYSSLDILWKSNTVFLLRNFWNKFSSNCLVLKTSVVWSIICKNLSIASMWVFHCYLMCYYCWLAFEWFCLLKNALFIMISLLKTFILVLDTFLLFLNKGLLTL